MLRLKLGWVRVMSAVKFGCVILVIRWLIATHKQRISAQFPFDLRKLGSGPRSDHSAAVNYALRGAAENVLLAQLDEERLDLHELRGDHPGKLCDRDGVTGRRGEVAVGLALVHVPDELDPKPARSQAASHEFGVGAPIGGEILEPRVLFGWFCGV